jgi:hypothetical protein
MLIILFESIHFVLKAEKLFKATKIEHKIVPTPRNISSDCGSAIRIAETDKDKAVEILEDKNINIKIVKEGA